MSAYQAAALWTGLLIVLLVVLGVRVMLARRRFRVSLGDGPEGQMVVPSRSFANAAEYIPIGVGAMIIMAGVGASRVEIHIVGAMLMVGRLLHPLGLIMPRAPNWARVSGMALTWSALLLSALILLMSALAV